MKQTNGVTNVGVKLSQDIAQNFFHIFLLATLVTVRDEETGEDQIVLDQWGANDENRRMLCVPPHKFVRTVVSLQRKRNKERNPSPETEFYVGVRGVDGSAGEFFEISNLKWVQHVQARLSGYWLTLFHEIPQAIYESPKRAKAAKQSPPTKPKQSRDNVIPFAKKKGKRRR